MLNQSALYEIGKQYAQLEALISTPAALWTEEREAEMNRILDRLAMAAQRAKA